MYHHLIFMIVIYKLSGVLYISDLFDEHSKSSDVREL